MIFKIERDSKTGLWHLYYDPVYRSRGFSSEQFVALLDHLSSRMPRGPSRHQQSIDMLAIVSQWKGQIKRELRNAPPDLSLETLGLGDDDD